jgi:hypothetical protein
LGVEGLGKTVIAVLDDLMRSYNIDKSWRTPLQCGVFEDALWPKETPKTLDNWLRDAIPLRLPMSEQRFWCYIYDLVKQESGQLQLLLCMPFDDVKRAWSEAH